MNREKAIELINTHIKTPHIVKHSYAVESVMRVLARKLDPKNEEMWGLAGLLHDLDNDTVDWKSDMSLHGPKTVEILKTEEFGNEEMYHAICAHNPCNGTKIENEFDRGSLCSRSNNWIHNCYSTCLSDKKISSVKVKSITKRMKETRFAAGANREAMKSIEKLGIEFSDFAKMSLDAMVQIGDVLGL